MSTDNHKFEEVLHFVKKQYNNQEFIPLHEPRFFGNEKKYLNECIDSTFVSSVGKFVDQFEQMVSDFTGAKYAIATANGTAALHVALILSKVERGDEVITQPLTFIATLNALSYIGAKPIFVDVDRDTLGMSPNKLAEFLDQNSEIRKGDCYNKLTGKRIRACVPMHTFGHSCKIDEILKVCNQYNIALVEDAAESLGTTYRNRHSGTFGKIGILSFNGNKTITTGGGGMLITNDEIIAKRAKHITTTAKVPHKWDFVHDEIGYNYRMPNINAALGCAQMEKLPEFIDNKRELASKYQLFFEKIGIEFIKEPAGSISNFWLNAVILKDEKERNKFLEYTNSNGVMTRPIWKLMNKLEMFSGAQTGNLGNSEWLEKRIVNIPSSAR